MSDGWVLAVFNAAAAGVLINAGVAKMIVPGPLLRASAELLPTLPRNSETIVRGFGATELGAAAALLFLPARLPAAIAVAALGCCFAWAGVVGMARGSSLPCGCFGGTSRQPLGRTNVALGIALAAVWPVNALAGRGPGPGYSLRTALLASIASAVLCLWLNRRLIARALPANRVPQPEVS
jgi:Methylamine utilisation protein MauE